MGSDWGEPGGKDWGGSEVHDWGVPGASGSALRWNAAEPEDAELGDTGLGDTGPADTGPADTGPGRTGPDDQTGDPGRPPSAATARASIDSAVLEAMRTRRHSFSAAASDDAGPTEDRLGSGDAAVYVLDDGSDHFMIGRAVGEDGDGCIYCLVARITLDRLSELQEGGAPSETAFTGSRVLSLSSVFVDDRAPNVVMIQHYDRIEDVPSEYRPPSPFLLFTDE